MRQVALFAEARGWHEKRLAEALCELGFEVSVLSLTHCGFSADSGRAPLLPGLSPELPQAAFVRAIPAGSFEQVTFRLSILHALRECGVLVYNDARVIERSVDKGMTSFLLARAGVHAVPAWVCESQAKAQRIVSRERALGHELVLKPLFGSQGRGLRRVTSPSELPRADAVAGVYYLQRYVQCEGPVARDYRVMVVDGRAVAAMERRASGWVTNRARGGQCFPLAAAGELASAAVAAADALDARYAGVDLIVDEGGRYAVLEVNGIPAWRGLQQVASVDIAANFARHVARELHAPPIERVS